MQLFKEIMIEYGIELEKFILSKQLTIEDYTNRFKKIEDKSLMNTSNVFVVSQFDEFIRYVVNFKRTNYLSEKEYNFLKQYKDDTHSQHDIIKKCQTFIKENYSNPYAAKTLNLIDFCKGLK